MTFQCGSCRSHDEKSEQEGRYVEIQLVIPQLSTFPCSNAVHLDQKNTQMRTNMEEKGSPLHQEKHLQRKLFRSSKVSQRRRRKSLEEEEGVNEASSSSSSPLFSFARLNGEGEFCHGIQSLGAGEKDSNSLPPSLSLFSPPPIERTVGGWGDRGRHFVKYASTSC